LFHKLKALGFTEIELKKTIRYIRNDAPLIIHVHLTNCLKFFVSATIITANSNRSRMQQAIGALRFILISVVCAPLLLRGLVSVQVADTHLSQSVRNKNQLWHIVFLCAFTMGGWFVQQNLCEGDGLRTSQGGRHNTRSPAHICTVCSYSVPAAVSVFSRGSADVFCICLIFCLFLLVALSVCCRQYGVLNICQDPNGVLVCRGYGDSYLLLKSETVRLRTSFASRDTSCAAAATRSRRRTIHGRCSASSLALLWARIPYGGCGGSTWRP
jgi:hypothetical protein